LDVRDGQLILDYDPPPAGARSPFYRPKVHLHQPASADNFSRTDPIRVRTRMNDLMADFLPQDPVAPPFDLIAVANEQGDVLYQSAFSEVRVDELSGLFHNRTARAGETAKGTDEKIPIATSAHAANGADAAKAPEDSYADALAMSGFREMEIVGSRYKVYTQPITLSVDPAGKTVHWLLCGLVRPDRFTSQTWSLSYFWIISLSFLTTIAVLCLPVVRLAGRQAGMLRSDAPMIAGAAFLLPAFATIFGAYLYHSFTYQSVTDIELKRLAEKVDQHFTEETRHIIGQLYHLTERLRDQSDRYADEPAVLKSERLFPLKDGYYKNFDLVFWTDDSGGQQVKWARGSDITPFLSLEHDISFRHLRYDRKALLDGEGEDLKAAQDSAKEFTFDPITSQTTGESIAVFGIRLANPIEAAADAKLTAAFMVCTPESLFHAVLPPGFGFAIVDDAGNVLFSHNPHLNQEENLFQETDNDKTMQAALNSVGEPFDVSYKGREHRIYVTPLQKIHRFPRLSLVVYKDGIYDETLAAEIAGMAATLYGYYVLSILLVAGLVRMFFWSRLRARFADRIWPAEEHRPEYAPVFVSLAPLAAVFFLSLFLVPFRLQIVLLPLAALLLPALAVVNSARILSGRLSTSRSARIARMRESLAQRPLAQVATLACAALILNVSVLPAAAFFRVAHLHETLNFLLVGQRKLADELEQRYEERRTQKQLSRGG
jgi:hypothetical protein